jgi:predicted metal-dependent hydrolase
MHGREHERMNAMIDAHGYPAAELDARLKVLLGAVQKTFPKRWQLAATCALEHYTALLGDLILSNPEILADAHPEMRRLWNWHAAEESEHKAVAFDVYQAAGGNAPERGFVMVVATVIFWAVLFDQQVRLMHADGIATSPKEWVKLGRFMFGKPARLQRLTAPLLDFFRPSFHPWDHDNSSVLEAWRHGHTAAAA